MKRQSADIYSLKFLYLFQCTRKDTLRAPSAVIDPYHRVSLYMLRQYGCNYCIVGRMEN